MAFNKENAKISKEYKRYFGIDINSTVLLPYVNLTNAEKEKLGIRTFDNESEYIKKEEKEGKTITTVTIELYGKVVNSTIPERNGTIIPLSFYISDAVTPQGSGSGKYEYICDDTNSIWSVHNEATNVEPTEYTKNLKGIRRSYSRETNFYKALKQMTGINEGLTRFDTKKLFKGDFSEVKSDIKEMVNYVKEKGDKIREFSVLYMIKRKVTTDEVKGQVTKYVQTIVSSAGFTQKEIRDYIEYNKSKNKLGDYYYEVDGVVLNYLSEFDDTMGITMSDTNTDNDVANLPY